MMTSKCEDDCQCTHYTSTLQVHFNFRRAKRGEASPPLPLSPLGEAISRNDLTAVHEILVKTGYKDDEGTEIELSFQVWTKLMQDMLNSMKRGGMAFRDEAFETATTVYGFGYHVLPTVFVRRSLACLLSEQAEAARRDAMQAQYVHPEWPTAFHMQAAALCKLGMDSDGTDILKEGVALDTKNQTMNRLSSA